MSKFVDMYNSLKNKNIIIIGALFLITIYRIFLMKGVPIVALANMYTDDAMGAIIAKNLLEGNWLGEYSYLLLQKGISFPVFLAVCNILSIDYLTAVSVTWIIAVAVFCYAMKYIISKRMAIILYTVLIFNPVMFQASVGQRVYRSTLAPALTLLIIGLYLILYFNVMKNDKYKISVAIVVGLCLGFFMNLRDDSIFIFPIIIVISIIILVVTIRKREQILKGCIMLIIPFLIIIGINQGICYMNYVNYGVWITTEPTQSSFKDFRDILYSIKMDEEIEGVSVSRAKLKALYEVSPTLKQYEPYLEASMDNWSTINSEKMHNEVPDGLIRWALRDGMNRGGAYITAKHADEVYKQITNEIQQAIDNGVFETQRVPMVDVLPVWKDDYTLDVIKWSGIALDRIISCRELHNDLGCVLYGTTGNTEEIRLFEALTGNLTLYPGQLQCNVYGWWAIDDNNPKISLVNKRTGEEVFIEFIESADIEAYLEENNMFYKNSKKCRFNVSIPMDDKDDIESMEFRYYYSDDEYKTLPVQASATEEYYLCIDSISSVGATDGNLKFVEKKVENVNIVANIVSGIMRVINYIGIMAFMIVTVYGIVKRKQLTFDIFHIWLVGVASFLTALVLIVPVAILQITAFDAVNSMYMAPCYPLIAIFSLLSIFSVYKILKERK